jgi:ankyrin repeat protein
MQVHKDSIFSACERGDLDISALGIPPLSTLKRLRDAKDRTLLDVSITFKHSHLVAKFLTPAFLVSAQDCGRALAHAVETGDVAVMTQVHSAICEINRASPMSGYDTEFERVRAGLLHSACRDGNTEVVRRFLAHVPNLDLNDAMLKAWSHGCLDIVRMLIEAGANSHLQRGGSFFRSVVSQSASESAMKAHGGNRQPLLDLLFSTGAWYDAASWGFWQCVGGVLPASLLRRLLAAAGDNVTPGFIQAAVESACRGGNADGARCLLETADERQVEINVNKMLDFALAQGHHDAAELIFERFGPREMSLLREGSGSDFSLEERNDVIPMRPSLVLVYAAACGSLVIVNAVLGLGNTDVNSVVPLCANGGMFTKPSLTALGAASDPDVIARLLDAKASVNPPGARPC